MPVWEGRISPLFDEAKELLVVEEEDGEELNRWEVGLGDGRPLDRASQLGNLSVEVLLCGGISRPVADRLQFGGVTVLSQLKGDAEQVLHAFLSGALPSARFTGPGARLGPK